MIHLKICRIAICVFIVDTNHQYQSITIWSVYFFSHFYYYNHFAFDLYLYTRVLLPALETMESKRHTSYRSYSTNVYIQNHWSTALKLLGKTAWTQIALSPETPWTLYNYIYLEDNTAYGAKFWWHNGAHNKNQKTPKTWNTVRYSVSNKQKPSTIKCNNCNWASVVQLVAKISERHRLRQNWKIQTLVRQISGAHSWWAKNAQLCHRIRNQ